MTQSVGVFRLTDSNGRKTDNILVVYDTGEVGLICEDDYYNGMLDIADSEKVAALIREHNTLCGSPSTEKE